MALIPVWQKLSSRVTGICHRIFSSRIQACLIRSTRITCPSYRRGASHEEPSEWGLNGYSSSRIKSSPPPPPRASLSQNQDASRRGNILGATECFFHTEGPMKRLIGKALPWLFHLSLVRGQSDCFQGLLSLNLASGSCYPLFVW